MLSQAAEYGRQFTLREILNRTRHQLELAGHPNIDPTKFLLMRVIGGFVALGLVYVATRVNPLQTWILGVVVGGLVFYSPVIWLNYRISRRKRAVLKTLPDVLDVVNFCMESGLNILSSIEIVNTMLDNEASRLLDRICQETELGYPLREAINRLNAYVDLQELGLFLNLIGVASELGVSLTRITSRVANHMRQRLSVRKTSIQVTIGLLLLLAFQLLYELLIGSLK